MVMIEALNAQHGDCLLLHYTVSVGGQSVPQLWLIDGGPAGTWNAVLKERLNQLAAARPTDFATGQRRLPIQLGVVTHIDSDHIVGINDMVAALMANPPVTGTPPVVFNEFWFNGFRQVLDGAADGQVAEVQAGLAGLAGGKAMLESVRQGLALQANMARLTDLDGNRLGLNRHFNEATKAKAPFSGYVAGVTVTILGPTQGQLDELRKIWAEKLAISPAQLAANERRDNSPTNRSSIAFLATVGGKTILFTGDALAEDLIAGWNAMEDRPETIDVMKVPHHGAAGNNSIAFFKLIPARHYIFCANGEHGNPDLKTLEMLFEALPGTNYSIHLTVPENHKAIAAQVALLKTHANGRVFFRNDADLSVCVAP